MAMMVFYKQLAKHGGSYRISIPTQIRHALSIRRGDMLEITVKGENIVMRKANTSFSERRVE